MKAFVISALGVAVPWFMLELMPQLKAELIRSLKTKVRQYLTARRNIERRDSTAESEEK